MNTEIENAFAEVKGDIEFHRGRIRAFDTSIEVSMLSKLVRRGLLKKLSIERRGCRASVLGAPTVSHRVVYYSLPT